MAAKIVNFGADARERMLAGVDILANAVSEFTFGPEALHLNLSVAQWASDGLLVLFFFAVGLELKHEFVAGELRDPRKAALPIVAAFGGVLAPALIYVLVNLGDSTALRGWAIPTATDIAFAVAVLAVEISLSRYPVAPALMAS